MEITTKSQQTSETILQFNNNKNGWGGYIKLSGDPTNCKLSYIHGVGSLLNYTDAERKKILDTALDSLKGHVIINTTSATVADFINKNYTVYYSNRTPVGYATDGYQYHICIRNDVKKNSYCRDPEKSSGSYAIAKEHLKAKLIEKLRSLKRKTDYVNDFVNEIFK